MSSRSTVSDVTDKLSGLAMAPDADVIVIGAGLAGLYAARVLHEAGKKVAVLEARDRVGGKTLTLTSKTGGRVDVGAAWVSDFTQPRVCELAREAGNTLFRQRVLGQTCWEVAPDTQLRYEDDGGVGDKSPINKVLGGIDLEDYNRIFTEIDRLSRNVNLQNPNATDRAAYYDGLTVAVWLDLEKARPLTRAALTPLCRSLVGAEMQETSMFYFMHYAMTAGGFFALIAADETGGQYQRTRNGNQSMSTWMQTSVLPKGAVKLNAVVSNIIQQPNSTLVQCRDGRQFVGKFVICTIPTPFYPQIRWEPALPVDKELLVQRSFLGTYSKMVLIYEKAWWLEQGWSGFCLSSEFPLSLVFDTCDGEYGTDDVNIKPRQHSLSCFIVAANGVEYTKHSWAERERLVKNHLGRMIGEQAQVDNTIEVLEFQWIKEEFSLGAPCPVTSLGAFTLYGDSHARPHGSVHFAGAELSPVWKGYMEGAIISGEATAKHVLTLL